jgi:hypothetical protein
MANLLTQFASLLEDFARLRSRHRYPARRQTNEYRKFRGYRRVESGHSHARSCSLSRPAASNVEPYAGRGQG